MPIPSQLKKQKGVAVPSPGSPTPTPAQQDAGHMPVPGTGSGIGMPGDPARTAESALKRRKEILAGRGVDNAMGDTSATDNDMITEDWNQYGQEYEQGVNQLWDDVMAQTAASAANREGQFANIMSSAGRRASELGPTGGGQQAAQLQGGVMAGREIADIQRQDALHQAELGMTMLQQRLKQAEAAKDRASQMAIQEMIQEMQLRIANIEAGGEDPGAVTGPTDPLVAQMKDAISQASGGGGSSQSTAWSGGSGGPNPVPGGVPQGHEDEYVGALPRGYVSSKDKNGNPYRLPGDEQPYNYHYSPDTGQWYREIDQGLAFGTTYQIVQDGPSLAQLNAMYQASTPEEPETSAGSSGGWGYGDENFYP